MRAKHRSIEMLDKNVIFKLFQLVSHDILSWLESWFFIEIKKRYFQEHK